MFRKYVSDLSDYLPKEDGVVISYDIKPRVVGWWPYLILTHLLKSFKENVMVWEILFPQKLKETQGVWQSCQIWSVFQKEFNRVNHEIHINGIICALLDKKLGCLLNLPFICRKYQHVRYIYKQKYYEKILTFEIIFRCLIRPILTYCTVIHYIIN